MKIVISDSTPLHYLVLIQKVDVLHQLYGRVIIPQAVFEELQHERTPASVKKWIKARPAWLKIKRLPATSDSSLRALGAGEQQAIRLAMQLHADLLLMDDKAGRHEALRRGLRVIGLIAVIEEAGRKGLLNLPEAIKGLLETNFRISQEILDSLMRPSHE